MISYNYLCNIDQIPFPLTENLRQLEIQKRRILRVNANKYIKFLIRILQFLKLTMKSLKIYLDL